MLDEVAEHRRRDHDREGQRQPFDDVEPNPGQDATDTGDIDDIIVRAGQKVDQNLLDVTDHEWHERADDKRSGHDHDPMIDFL